MSAGNGAVPVSARRRTTRTATPRGPGATEYDHLYRKYLIMLTCAGERRQAMGYCYLLGVAWTAAWSCVLAASIAGVWWPLLGAVGCLVFAAADLRLLRQAYQGGERAWTLATDSVVAENRADEKKMGERERATQEEEKGE